MSEQEERGRFMTVTYDGITYRIPEMWVAGYCRNGMHTIPEAVALWASYEACEQEIKAETPR